MFLRRLTFRLSSRQMSIIQRDVLLRVLATITSPVFCEFVLELSGVPSQFTGPSSAYWGRWGSIDDFIDERFSQRGDFRVIISTGELCDWENFQWHAKRAFPLLAKRGCIHFEMPH